MSQRHPTDFVFLTLNITRGAHFDAWKNLHLQIVLTLEKTYLNSRYFLGTSQPRINETFAWRLTAGHFDKLEKLKREILIEVVVEESGKSWTAASGSLGIQHAQDITPNTVLYARDISLQPLKNPVETGPRPKLNATLAIRSTPPSDKYGHIAYLSESSATQGAGPSGKGIRKTSNTNLTKNDGTTETAKKTKNVTFRDTNGNETGV